jgi:nucleotide-binding universal stress UspA family protein
MFRKLLMPVDGSEGARRAVRVAGELAEKFDAAITLLHVVEIRPGLMAGGEVAGMVGAEALVEQGYEQAKQILADARADLALPAERVTEEVLSGHPAETICRTAKQGDYDLIVVGSRGLSQVAAFFLGSVSDRVSHHAPCSVLIVR